MKKFVTMHGHMNVKKLGREWGKGFMYIKGWFKPIFPLFLNRLLRKLKFQILMLDFAPTSSLIVTSQVMSVVITYNKS